MGGPLDNALVATDELSSDRLGGDSLHATNIAYHPALTTEHLLHSSGRDDRQGVLYFRSLHHALVARSAVWTGPRKTGGLFRLVEQGGEAGEVLDAIMPVLEHLRAVTKGLNTGKKLHREEQGWAGSRASKKQLADELADSVITAYNTANEYDVDLDAALVEKFNETSKKVGIKVLMLA